MIWFLPLHSIDFTHVKINTFSFFGQIIMWWRVAGVSVPAEPGCLRWRKMESNSVENVTDHVLKVDGHEATAVSKFRGDRSALSNVRPWTKQISHSLCHQMFCVGHRSPVKVGSQATAFTLVCLCFLINKDNCVCSISHETVGKRWHVITTRNQLQYNSYMHLTQHLNGRFQGQIWIRIINTNNWSHGHD